mmetsp:Transcript_29359/g.93637  ORF Transcript_29359/g.93637 Transcript_29359/m.93637 type:complete len:122 (-) Transcript_29359:219-584(-)
MAGELHALEERFEVLRREVEAGQLTHRAADDEGTKILQAADCLDLHGEERGRRRQLVRCLEELLSAAPGAAMARPEGMRPPSSPVPTGNLAARGEPCPDGYRSRDTSRDFRNCGKGDCRLL